MHNFYNIVQNTTHVVYFLNASILSLCHTTKRKRYALRYTTCVRKICPWRINKSDEIPLTYGCIWKYEIMLLLLEFLLNKFRWNAKSCSIILVQLLYQVGDAWTYYNKCILTRPRLPSLKFCTFFYFYLNIVAFYFQLLLRNFISIL